MKLLGFGMFPTDKICGICFTGDISVPVFVLNTVSTTRLSKGGIFLEEIPRTALRNDGGNAKKRTGKENEGGKKERKEDRETRT